jgi:hypothetical protein
VPVRSGVCSPSRWSDRIGRFRHRSDTLVPALDPDLAALVLRRQREAAAALATFDVLFLVGLIVSVIALAPTLARASPRVLAAGRTLAAALAVVAVDQEIFAEGVWRRWHHGHSSGALAMAGPRPASDARARFARHPVVRCRLRSPSEVSLTYSPTGLIFAAFLHGRSSMPPSLAAKGIWRLAQGTDRRCTGRFSSDPSVMSLIDGSIVLYYWHRCWT